MKAVVASIVALGVALVVALGAGTASADDGVMRERAASRVTVIPAPGLEATGHELGAIAETELQKIAEDLVDLPAPKNVEIRLVRDASELASVTPVGRAVPSWAIGVAFPDLGVIAIATRRGAQIVDPESTLRHELAHIALGAALGNRAPHWLHEGFAYQHSGEWSWDRTETLAGMSWFGGVIPLDELDAQFPQQELPANRAYAEAYDFVGYLSRRGRYEEPDDDGDRWPFRRFLADLGHGKDIDAAAIHAFGKPVRLLFEEWRSDLSKRYLWAPVGLLGLAMWILCAFLLMLAWRRRRRQNRSRIAQWEREESVRQESNLVVAPPYVPWPGLDPLDEEPDEGHEPRLPN